MNYGSAPKVAVGLIVGFVAGKLSYKNACEEKILRLPGGRLKESVLMSRRTTEGLWGAATQDGGYVTMCDSWTAKSLCINAN